MMKKKVFLLKSLGTSFFLIWISTGCAPLNTRQLTAVTTFSQAADSFVVSQRNVYHTLAELRLQRGLFFSVTLFDPSARTLELERMISARNKEIALSKKADLAFETVSQYMRSLKMLSSTNRVTGVPLELRTLGKKIDSMLMLYNALGDVRPVPQGYATLFGKFVGRGTEWTLQYLQAKQVKQLIVNGDTLVSSLMGVMIETLMNEDLNTQIEHERRMLKQTYTAYLSSAVSGDALQNDERYVALVDKLDKLNALRLKASQTARSIKKAHNKLKETCLKSNTWEEDYQWILSAQAQMKAVQSDWKKFETLID